METTSWTRMPSTAQCITPWFVFWTVQKSVLSVLFYLHSHQPCCCMLFESCDVWMSSLLAMTWLWYITLTVEYSPGITIWSRPVPSTVQSRPVPSASMVFDCMLEEKQIDLKPNPGYLGCCQVQKSSQVQVPRTSHTPCGICKQGEHPFIRKGKLELLPVLGEMWPSNLHVPKQSGVTN